MAFPSPREWHHNHYVYEIPSIIIQSFTSEGEFALTLGNGTVYLIAVQVKTRLTVSGIVVAHDTVAAGNIRVGLYGPDNPFVPTGPFGLPLVDESASVAVNGINRTQHVPFSTPQQLEPGLYWMAFRIDNTLDVYWTYSLNGDWKTGDHINFTVSYAGAYGAFTDPCPAVVDVNTVPIILLRVSAIP